MLSRAVVLDIFDCGDSAVQMLMRIYKASSVGRRARISEICLIYELLL